MPGEPKIRWPDESRELSPRWASTPRGVDPRPAGCGRLVGYDELWRIRIGDCRVTYTIKDTELVVLVLRIAHRSVVYRGI